MHATDADLGNPGNAGQILMPLGTIGAMGGAAIQGAYNAREARKNRRFQKKMYKHRFRYSVNDMKKAGINPILAADAGLGGGGSPGGSAATISQPDLGGAINTSKDLRQKKTLRKEQEALATQQALNSAQMLKQSEEQTKLLNAQKLKTHAETESIGWRRPFADVGKDVSKLYKTGKGAVTNPNFWKNQMQNFKEGFNSLTADSPARRAASAYEEWQADKKKRAGSPAKVKSNYRERQRRRRKTRGQ